MSNSLAIATVTASLQNLLQSAFNTNQPDHLDGAQVTTLPLGDVPVNARGANVFLYQVSENPGLRNNVMPSRNSSGATVKPPQTALDLHYLISFYGTQNKLEPQRFLSIAVRTLNAIPTISKQIIAQTLQAAAMPGATFDFLAPTDLADGPELVRLTPTMISLEEMSKLWSILLQQKYVLSVLYVASVVLLDSTESGVTALPVLQNNVTVNVMRSLAIVQVLATDTTTFGAILAGAQVAVTGRGLTAPGLAVSIDGVRQTVTFLVQTDNRIEFVLPSTLRAGAHGLRMAAYFGANTLPTNESNQVTFSLRPTIIGPISKSTTPFIPPPTSPPTSPPTGFFNGTLTVQVSPRVAATQRKALLLNRKDAPPGLAVTGAVLTLHPAPPGDLSDTDTLVFPFTDLPSGRYAVRVRIDDAESPPVVVVASPPTSPPGGTLGPEVVIP